MVLVVIEANLEMLVKRATVVRLDRRVIRDLKAQEATMVIEVILENQLQAPQVKKAKKEPTARRATKARMVSKDHVVIRVRQDLRAIEATLARVEPASPDPKEKEVRQETKVTEASKVLRVIEVLTTRVRSVRQEIRVKLARKALEVIQESRVVRAPKVLKARKEKKDLMVEAVQLANKVLEVLVDPEAPTAFPAASKRKKTKSD